MKVIVVWNNMSEYDYLRIYGQKYTFMIDFTLSKLLKSAICINVKWNVFSLKYILNNVLPCFNEVHLFWCVD